MTLNYEGMVNCDEMSLTRTFEAAAGALRAPA
jgi:hypothetical protein